MNRIIRCSVLVPMFLLLGLAQPADPEPMLQRLRPTEARSYFLAGEQLIEHPSTVQAGRETLAVCLLLSAERDPPLAASAAIALASVARTTQEQRGLWALAVELDPSRGEDRRWTAAAAGSADSTDLLAARVIGGLRVNSRDATAVLREQPQVRSRILEEGNRLGFETSRIVAVLTQWESNTLNDPCRGQMVVRVREGTGMRAVPCPNPDHHHGVRHDSPDWAMMVGIEMSLLRAMPSGWSAQAVMGLDAGVPVWTLARLAREYGVSASRPIRRAGRWQEP